MLTPHWLDTPTVYALGWTLLHTLWQAVLVALFIRLLWLGVSQRRARARYGLTLSALSLILAMAIATFAYYYRSYQPMTFENPASALLAMPFPEETSLPRLDWDSEGITANPEAPEMSALTAAIYAVEGYLPWLVAAWLLGTIIMGLRLAGGWWQLQRLSNKGIAPLPAEWADRFTRLTYRMGVRRRVALRFSRLVAEPIALKHLKPVILFPVGLINQLTTEQVEAILLHELAHIRRWDYLVNWLQSILELLFFYHPAVWWLSGQAREAREHCCDDLVLRRGGARPMLYAQTLTQLTALSFTRKTKLAMSVKGTNGTFTQRVKRLFGHYETGFDWRKPVLSAVVCTVLLLSLGLSSRAEEDTTVDVMKENPELATPAAMDTMAEQADTLPRKAKIYVSKDQIEFVRAEGTIELYTYLGRSDEQKPIILPVSKYAIPLDDAPEILLLDGSAEPRLVNDYADLEQIDPGQIVMIKSYPALTTADGRSRPQRLLIYTQNHLQRTSGETGAGVSVRDGRLHIRKPGGSFDWYRFPEKIQLGDSPNEVVRTVMSDLSIDLTKAPQIILMNVEPREIEDYRTLETLQVDDLVMIKQYPAPGSRKERFLFYTKEHLRQYPDAVPAVEFDPKAEEEQKVLSGAFQTRPLFIVDGQRWGRDPGLIREIDPANINAMNVLKNMTALEKYGPEAEDGAIEITTKSGDQPVPAPLMEEGKPTIRIWEKDDGGQLKPLIILDGKVQGRDTSIIGKYDHLDIDHINVLKGLQAFNKYGSEAEDGAIEIFTKKDQKEPSVKTGFNYPPGLKEELFMRGIRVKNPIYIVNGENWGRDPEKIKTLRVDDIQKLDHLKGEAAREIYGEDGLGGVLIIETSKKEKTERDQPASGGITIGGEGVYPVQKNPPLYIIDDTRWIRSQNAIRDLDPSDIESITVLKGDQAVAEYGEEGRHGVIIIVTKSKSYAPVVPREPLYVVNGQPIPADRPWREIGQLDMRRLGHLPPKEAVRKYGRKARYGAVLLQYTQEGGVWSGQKPFVPLNRVNLHSKIKAQMKSPNVAHYFADGLPVSREVFLQFNHLHFAKEGTVAFRRVGKVMGEKRGNANLERIRKRYRGEAFVYEVGPGIVVVEFYNECENDIPIGLVYSSFGQDILREETIYKNRIRAANPPSVWRIKCGEETEDQAVLPERKEPAPPELGPELNTSLRVAQQIKGTFQAYPNPFQNETKLVFELTEGLQARISVFNANGQLVEILVNNEQLAAGRHEFIWQSGNAPKGSYVVMIEAGGSRITQTIQKQ